MATIAVFGGTGRTGRHVVDLALVVSSAVIGVVGHVKGSPATLRTDGTRTITEAGL